MYCVLDETSLLKDTGRRLEVVSTNCSISNNVLQRLRHVVSLSIYRSSLSPNVFEGVDFSRIVSLFVTDQPNDLRLVLPSTLKTFKTVDCPRLVVDFSQCRLSKLVCGLNVPRLDAITFDKYLDQLVVFKSYSQPLLSLKNMNKLEKFVYYNNVNRSPVGNYFPSSLRRLSIDYIRNETIALIQSVLPHLEQFCFSSSACLPDLDFDKFVNLQSLRFAVFCRCTTFELSRPASTLKMLTIGSGNPLNFDDHYDTILSVTKFESLTQLSLLATNVDDSVMKKLKHVATLRVLRVCDENHITSCSLSTLSNITVLNVTGCSRLKLTERVLRRLHRLYIASVDKRISPSSMQHIGSLVLSCDPSDEAEEQERLGSMFKKTHRLSMCIDPYFGKTSIQGTFCLERPSDY